MSMLRSVYIIVGYAMLVLVLSSGLMLLGGVVLEWLGLPLREVLDDVVTAKQADRGGFYGMLLISCILVPFVETLFLQHWLIGLLQKYLTSPSLITLICGLAFGIVHPYGISYMICMSLVGLVYAAAYLYIAGSESKRIAFATLFLSHALSNALALLI